MKLSTYYKRKKEIVILSPTFSPERYSSFILRKDYDDGHFPSKLNNTPNLEYGGLAFSGNIYTPLPIEVERMKPDTSIYEKMEKVIYQTSAADRKKIYKNMSEAEHIRLSLDGKTIWEEYGRQFKNLKTARNLMIHDYDLGKVEGALSEVRGILARARNDGWATKIGMKFPPSISTGEDLLGWTSLNPNSTFYSLRYNGIIPDNYFLKYVSSCNQKAVYNQMEYYVDHGCSGENDFVKNRLQKILRQVIIARSHKAFFSLKYEDNFFFDKRWEKVIQLLNFYLGSLKHANSAIYNKLMLMDTVFDFAKGSDEIPAKFYKGKAFSTSEIREIFMFVREVYPPLFKDFYECNLTTIKEAEYDRD